MNRRNLLSSLAVVGTGLALGAGLSSDLYAAPALELTPAEDKALSAFQHDLEWGLAPHTTSARNLANKMAKPARLVSRKKTKKGNEVRVKNRNGDYLTLITRDGHIAISVTK